VHRGVGHLSRISVFTLPFRRTGTPSKGGNLRTTRLFIRNLGFITPTEARRISFDETLRFEKIHEETYKKFGFELVEIAPASLAERVSIVKTAIG
jgi:predicted ATPase